MRLSEAQLAWLVALGGGGLLLLAICSGGGCMGAKPFEHSAEGLCAATCTQRVENGSYRGPAFGGYTVMTEDARNPGVCSCISYPKVPLDEIAACDGKQTKESITDGFTTTNPLHDITASATGWTILR